MKSFYHLTFFKIVTYFSYEQQQHVSLTMVQLSVPSSASAVGHQPQGLRSSLQQHVYILFCNNSTLPRELHTSYKLRFIYLHAGCGAGRCYSQVWPVRLSVKSTSYCRNWPVDRVSCWKSGFCADVRSVTLCNYVHTQQGFNCTLEGKTEGLSGFYFKVPFQGKLAAGARIQILLVLRAKLLVWIIQMSVYWFYASRTLHLYSPL